MSDIEDRVMAIVIPSGNYKLNRDRMEAAIRVNEERGLNAPYILSGIGRDINAVLWGTNGKGGMYKLTPKGIEVNEDFCPEDFKDFEFHDDMWDYMMQNTEGIIGIDMLSTDSEGNILNTLSGVSGRYCLPSYPRHLRRFKKTVEKGKKDGKLSSDLEIEYVATRTPPEQIAYETARVMLGPFRPLIKKTVYGVARIVSGLRPIIKKIARH